MRKIIIAALIVFTLALAVGFVTTDKAEAGTRCWYECAGDGEYLYCCRTNGKLLCKIVFSAPISCP